MKRLYVDDCRPVPAGWRLARTVEEALALLSAEVFEEVSLDYFIGDGDAGTFLAVAHFIADLPAERRPCRVYLHTASDAGAAQMAKVLHGRVDAVLR